MRQLTPGVRNVMHMRAAGRPAAADAAGGGELAARDAASRFVSSAANGGAEAMARMRIGLSPEQKRWVDQEAVRRGVPKSVVVRELLDRALTGKGPFDPREVHDVAPAGAVHDVAGAVHGVAGLGGDVPVGGGAVAEDAAAGGDPAAAARRGARVPEVKLVGPEPYPPGAGAAGPHARAHGHPYYADPAAVPGAAGLPHDGSAPYPVRERVAGDLGAGGGGRCVGGGQLGAHRPRAGGGRDVDAAGGAPAGRGRPPRVGAGGRVAPRGHVRGRGVGGSGLEVPGRLRRPRGGRVGRPRHAARRAARGFDAGGAGAGRLVRERPARGRRRRRRLPVGPAAAPEVRAARLRGRDGGPRLRLPRLELRGEPVRVPRGRDLRRARVRSGRFRVAGSGVRRPPGVPPLAPAVRGASRAAAAARSGCAPP